MKTLPRSYKRLLMLMASVPVALVVLGALYSVGMVRLEGVDRSLAEGVAWAAETITTVGYGHDSEWRHPLMRAFVILVQFSGVMYIFLVFPVFFIPFVGERFETRIDRRLPHLSGEVLIYRSGPELTEFVSSLDREGIPAVFLEEDESQARRLRERHQYVVLSDLANEDPAFQELTNARGIVLNGSDEANATLALGARAAGFEGPIFALLRDPALRAPLTRTGVDTALASEQLLAAAVAGRASRKLRRRVANVGQLGKNLEVFEFRVAQESSLVGMSLEGAKIRESTGTTIIGFWENGRLQASPTPELTFHPGAIFVAVGPEEGLDRLSELAIPMKATGRFLVVGYGTAGQEIARLMREAGEEVTVISDTAGNGVDVVGNHLDLDLLGAGGLSTAQGVVIALDDDTKALFATAVVRSLSKDVHIFVAAQRLENVSRLHSAGAGYALSEAQVTDTLLKRHLMGMESLSLEPEITLAATSPGHLFGRRLVTRKVREETGCTVVAVERGERIVVDFSGDFRPKPTDIIYISGSHDAVAEYFRRNPGSQRVNRPQPETQG